MLKKKKIEYLHPIDLIEEVRRIMPLLSREARLELCDALMEGYYKHCGSYTQSCQCWNNE